LPRRLVFKGGPADQGGATVKLRTIAAATIAATALLTPRLHAQTLEIPALPAPIPGPTAEGRALELDLITAYQMAMSRNLDLQVGRFSIASADAGVQTAAGVFDPNFGLGASGDWTQTPSTTVLEGSLVPEYRNTRFGIGLDGLLPTGTLWSAEIASNRFETNSTFYFLTPAWNSDLTLSLTQPLLRGFGTLVNRSAIVVARNSRAQTAEAFEILVIDTLRQVENAYWNLVAARRAVQVAEQSLALAERLLGETRERVKVGTSAPIDLVQSEAGVATRRQALITARNVSSNAEDALKTVLGFDQPAEWLTTIETTQTYEFAPFLPDLAASIETGLAKRPEIRQQQLRSELLDYYVRMARNDVLPSLDLQASYGWGGVGGKGETVDPVTGDPIVVDDGFPDSIDQIANRDFPNWRLGVQLGIPIGNNAAQGRLAQRRFEHERSLVEMAALQQDIVAQVRIAVRALEDGAAAVEASVASQSLAARNLEAEQTKFDNGLSTNFQVLQIQEDLAEAELALIRSYLDYRKANIGYRYATGTLLDFLDVDIVDPGQPDVPNDYWKDVEWMQFDDFAGAAASTTPAAAPAP
jgi:outer membrane protein TolC